MSRLSKKFDFYNKDGVLLSGRLELPAIKPRAYAIFAHCFTCSKNILAATRISRELTQSGIGVLRFDFTGIGNSEGDFANTNFSSNVGDLISAYEELSKEVAEPQILIGHSLGGAAVLRAATKLPKVKAVVTIGAPSDVQHVIHTFQTELEQIEKLGEAEVNLAGRRFKIKKQFVDDLRESEILEGVAHFNKALLVMHSPIDNTVSIEHAANIFLKAKHPKSFISLDTADHLVTNPDDAQYVAQVIAAWVNRYVRVSENKTKLSDANDIVVSSRGGFKFTQDIINGNHAIVADEPTSIGGDDLGFAPYDLLLSALGACTSMTMKMYADHKKWPLESAKVILKHDKIHAEDCATCETQAGKIDKITKEIFVSGPLDDAQRQKLFEIAEKCPVNRTLKSEILIENISQVTN